MRCALFLDDVRDGYKKGPARGGYVANDREPRPRTRPHTVGRLGCTADPRDLPLAQPARWCHAQGSTTAASLPGSTDPMGALRGRNRTGALDVMQSSSSPSRNQPDRV